MIEKVLNHYLQLDTNTPARLAALAGKVVAVKLQPLNWSFYFLFEQHGVRLAKHHEGTIDLSLEGSWFDFLRLSRDSSNAAFFASKLRASGDLAVAQQFKELFAHLDIDWEEQLSHITGDIMAHQLGRLLRAFSSWARQSTAILGQNVTEYVQEEARLFPPREELQDFFTAIDQVRDDVERIRLRIERLAARSAL